MCERYAFYSVRGGRLLRGRVAHAPYRISPAALVSEAGSAPLGWDGLRGFPTDTPPDLVHCCDGVEVRAGFPEWVRA